MTFTPWDNPMGTDGFEFIEYAAPDPAAMGALFERMGFVAIARHRHKNVLLYRQGEINFIVNAEPDSFAQRFARLHGPSICAIAFRVQDAAGLRARQGPGRLGLCRHRRPGRAEHPGHQGHRRQPDLLGRPLARQGRRAAGRHRQHRLLRRGLRAPAGRPAPKSLNPAGHGLTYIDHLTHNVHRGRMGEWADFYERLFNFREVRYFDIEGQVTGVKSKAMTSPCGKIRIPINEEGNDKAGPDPGVPGHVPRRGHPAHRAGLAATSTTPWTRCAQRACAARHHRHLLRAGGQAHPRPRRGRGRAEGAQDPDRRQGRRSCCCRSSARTSSGRSSSSSSSARATRALAKATSRRCSRAWNSTRCAAACWRSGEGLTAAGREPGRGPGHRRRREPGVAPVTYGDRQPPAARRLRPRAQRLHLRAGPRPLHGGRTTTPTGACTRANCSSCRAWPARPSSPRSASWATRPDSALRRRVSERLTAPRAGRSWPCPG
jgi:hypothetical protein